MFFCVCRFILSIFNSLLSLKDTCIDASIAVFMHDKYILLLFSFYSTFMLKLRIIFQLYFHDGETVIFKYMYIIRRIKDVDVFIINTRCLLAFSPYAWGILMLLHTKSVAKLLNSLVSLFVDIS